MSDNVLDQIPLLSPEKRQEAREQAHELVIRRAGPRPNRKDFQDRRISMYPGWITTTIMIFLVVLFIASFLPSVFHLFNAGRDYFNSGIVDQPAQAAIVGIASFLMAEVTVILATIVQRVYFQGQSQRLLNSAIIIGVLIAMLGNVASAQPKYELTFQAAFDWLLTLGPSIIVFVTSAILKQIMFSSIEHRMLNEQDYQDILKSWESKVSNPEADPKFMAVYGSVTRDLITKAFVVGAKANERRELLNSLSNKEWLELFIRELRQENWVPTNIIFEQEKVIVDADGRSEVGPGESPLSPSLQPSYGFKTDHSND